MHAGEVLSMQPVEAVRIRTITNTDMAAMVEIDRRIVGKQRAVSWPQKVSSHFRTYYPPLSFVAEVDGKVVGFIIGVIMGAEYALPLSGWINIIGVDPDYQGRGVGSALMESFIEACRRRGIKCRLMVRQNDDSLKRMLARLGFEQGDLVDYVRGFG